MPKKAEYKSSLRSKALIKEAFIELLRTKPAEKITVTDIVKKANINRGTFYAHYSDIGKLVAAIEDEIVQTLCDMLYDLRGADPLEDPLPLFLKISEFVEEKKELLSALLYANNTKMFIFQLPDLITKELLASESIDEHLRRDPLFMNRCRFYAGGAASLYTAWFQGALDGTLEDVAYTLAKIIKGQEK